MRSNNSLRPIGIIVLVLGFFAQGFLLGKKKGSPCSSHNDCNSNLCSRKTKKCKPRKANGVKCKRDKTCKSGKCSKKKKVCTAKKPLLQRILLASSQALNKAQDLAAFGVKAQSASRSSPALEEGPRVVQNLRI